MNTVGRGVCVRSCAVLHPEVTLQAQWLAKDPSKRWGEVFFLYYSLVWIAIFGVVVVFQLYESWEDLGYFLCGQVVALPGLVYPVLLPGKHDARIPWNQRFVFKAHMWVAVISFVGNYFWTHYFYEVLAAKYTFPITWELNRVPIMLFFLTHAYFVTYHTLASIVQRRFYSTCTWSPFGRFVGSCLLVFTMSVCTAFMETVTIATVPYYSFQNRFAMYSVGSMFYGIYFYVSFPMYLRVDEDPREKWTMTRSFLDSMAACMLVTLILDFWRLAVGSTDTMRQLFHVDSEHIERVPFIRLSP